MSSALIVAGATFPGDGNPGTIPPPQILNGGSVLAGQTGVDQPLDITVVPDVDPPGGVQWFIDDVLFRDDDTNAPFTLKYASGLLQLNTTEVAPSGNSFTIATDGSTYEIEARGMEADGTTVIWTSEATFTTVDDGSTSGPGGGSNPGTGVGSYTQDPFTVTFAGSLSGTLDFTPADYPFDLIFVRDPSHVGVVGAGTTRGALTTIGSGTATISASSQAGSPTGSGTSGSPYTYLEDHFPGQVTIDGSAGEVHVKLDTCWVEGNGNYGIYIPSTGRENVHLTVVDSDIERSSGIIDTGIGFCDDLTVLRCMVADCGDGIKFGDLALVEDCYFRAQVEAGKHVDIFQWNDNATGEATIRRCWMQTHSLDGGTDHYGNSGLQVKPNDGGPVKFVIEDCFVQARNYGINRNGNNVSSSYYVSRRCIFKPSLNADHSTWSVGSDPFKDGLSPKSSGPDRTTRTDTDSRLFGGGTW